MDTPTQTKPALIRLGAAAQVLGLTSEHLARGVLDGSVPLQVVRISQTTFFRSVELNAWHRGLPAPPPSAYDLF
jgi:hypothetical protein